MSDTVVNLTTKKDWTSDQEVRWCAGCGDYGILLAVHQLAIAAQRSEIVLVGDDEQHVRSSRRRGVCRDKQDQQSRRKCDISHDDVSLQLITIMSEVPFSGLRSELRG